MVQDPREQPIYPAPQPAQPGYAPGTYYVAPAPVPIKKPGFGAVLFRTVRLLFRRFIYGLVLLWRAIRPAVGYIALSLVALGIIGWLSFQLWGPKPGAPRDVRVAAVLPASAVENYIKGQQSFNADMMWSAYSPTYQAAQLQRGATKETLQARVDNERLRGLKYVQYEYVGGVQLEDGGGMYYYAVKLEFQGQQAKLPMIFTVDTDGKVIRVMSPLSE